jgi:glycosyltransferase involved in cell wall biosynthesis
MSLSSREALLIGAVVPAFDEEESIGACLESILAASRCPELRGETVLMVVALDSCTDRTEGIARSWGASTVCVDARNVGIARAKGAQLALDAGARWLAFTDADSTVATNWFSAQLRLGHDAVCGTVAVHDWSSYDVQVRREYDAAYTDADGHRHIHGANLGVCAQAYQRVGGFSPLCSSEDVALVRALHDSGASIAWSALPRVTTSARRAFRAPNGFGSLLQRMESKSAPGDEACQ